jgi:hypothetical protein
VHDRQSPWPVRSVKVRVAPGARVRDFIEDLPRVAQRVDMTVMGLELQLLQ